MTSTHRMVFGRYDYAAFFTFASYAGCSMILPLVLIPLAADLHFPLAEGGMGQGGALQVGRSIPMVLSMLICGMIAGRWGKRRSLGVSVLLMGLGISLAALAPGYGLLFAAVVVAGLGEGVVEGLATPLVQDFHPEEPGRYINVAHAFWSIGLVAVTLFVGWLLLRGVSWRTLALGIGALALVPAAFLLLPTRKYRGRFNPAEKKLSSGQVWGHFKETVRQPRFWLFFWAMFLAGGGEFCLTFWCPSFIRLVTGGSPWDSGLGTAFFAGGMIAGRIGSGFLVRQHKLYALVMVSALVAVVASLFIPWCGESKLALFGLLAVSGIATGPFWPSIQSYCVDRIPTDSTMIFILLSCAGVPGCGVFTWVMGLVGDAWGLRVAFYLVPACFLIMGLLLLADRLLSPPPRSAEL